MLLVKKFHLLVQLLQPSIHLFLEATNIARNRKYCVVEILMKEPKRLFHFCVWVKPEWKQHLKAEVNKLELSLFENGTKVLNPPCQQWTANQTNLMCCVNIIIFLLQLW